MKKTPVKVSVCDVTEEIFKGRGLYYTDGRLKCVIDEFDGLLEINPLSYNQKNPRRLLYTDTNGDQRWSKFYLRSMLMDVKPVKTVPKKK